jgi:alginate O-acetyltransferase complex protein AlgI
LLFNSYVFLFVFLPVVLAGYALAGRYGNRPVFAWLVTASLFFYGWWNPLLLWLIVLSITVNYAFAGHLTRSPGKGALALAISFNLGLLGYFKYAGFLTQILSDATGSGFQLGELILPLGISFFTFQQITYLVDSNAGRTVNHGWLEYGLFVTFFPQLVAGPIVHQAEILPQFIHGRHRLRARNLAIGLTIFALGLFKKVVIADHMATYATPVFNAAAAGEVITFLEAWGGATAYTFQIYFDFSGYSDMAIGLARMFGIRLPLNFHSPYKAHNIIDFWSRWHMTLSRFLRDYLYIPFGGNRKGSARRYLNLMVVMLLGGLWHGAGWTFVLWGGLHGFYLICNHAWRGLAGSLGLLADRPRWWTRGLSWSATFLAVMVAWVFFRATSFDAALNVLRGMAALDGRLVVTPGYVPIMEVLRPVLGEFTVRSQPLLYYNGMEQFLWLAGGVFSVLALPNTQEWMQRYLPTTGRISPPTYFPRRFLWRPTPMWAVFAMIVIGVSLIGTMQPSEFLYWKF